jgi:plasmid stabilization system protein ParE
VQIKWTNKARNDLYSVEEYISRDNPTAAVDTVLKIIETVESLATFTQTDAPAEYRTRGSW